jgi:alpha-1,3-rhamnosyltransferase
MSDPLATVWIPSYNHARFLPRTLECALGQTYANTEVVLVDDGSTDGSLEIAHEYARTHSNLRVVTHPGHKNRGLVETAALCHATAHGKYLAGLPSDDLIVLDKIERDVAMLEADPEAAFAYGYVQMIDENGEPLRGRSLQGRDLSLEERPIERLLRENVAPGVAFTYRRSAFEAVGGVRGRALYADWELAALLVSRWHGAFDDRVVALHRVHGSNTSLGVPIDVENERLRGVLIALRERGPEVGGTLDEPRTQAALELQLAFLLFGSGDRPEAERSLRRAFGLDPALLEDEVFFREWLQAVHLQPFHPAVDPAEAELASRRLRAGLDTDFEDIFGVWLMHRLPADAGNLRALIAQLVVPLGFRYAVRGYATRRQRRPLVRAGLRFVDSQRRVWGARSLVGALPRLLRRRRAPAPILAPPVGK